NTAVTVITANPGANSGLVHTVTLGSQGTADLLVKPTDLLPPK
ncbi:MAG: hypothetical protein QOI78_3414, partial [Actinomycetota bacterium]|nr:hypothetical protein [Actinomycetota bacterium]